MFPMNLPKSWQAIPLRIPVRTGSLPSDDPVAGQRFAGLFELGEPTTIGEILNAKPGDPAPRVAHRMINPTTKDILDQADRLIYPERFEKDNGKTKQTPPEDACASCGMKDGGGDDTLKRCVGCKKALYCGKECQKTDWKNHKGMCKQS